MDDLHPERDDAPDASDEIARYRRSQYGAGGRRESYREQVADAYSLEDSPSESAPTPKRKGGRTAAVVAVALAALVLVGAGAAFAYMSGIAGNLHEGVDQGLRDALVKTDMANEPFYVLLLGTDQSAQRDEEGELDGIYRSDSMMLARVDPVKKKVALVSIPRDTMVDLGEYGIQKINAARAFGGPALAVRAVSDLAGVRIAHYAEIDFDGFRAIVDALGGVEVEVPVEIDDWDAGGHVDAGLQTLDGEQALILCRSRNTFTYIVADPDLMRAANQRMVLSAIAHKLLASDVATIASTVGAVSEYVTTDLELNDIVGIAQTMKDLDPASDIYTATMPGTSEYVYASPEIAEGYYEKVDEQAWAEMVRRMDAGLPPSETAEYEEKTGIVLSSAGEGAADSTQRLATVDVKNGTDRDGLAKKAQNLLEAAGFVNVVAGQAVDNYEYPDTLVIYDDPAQAYEASQIVAALGQGKASVNDGTYLFDADFLVVIGDDWQDDAGKEAQS